MMHQDFSMEMAGMDLSAMVLKDSVNLTGGQGMARLSSDFLGIHSGSQVLGLLLQEKDHVLPLLLLLISGTERTIF